MKQEEPDRYLRLNHLSGKTYFDIRFAPRVPGLITTCGRLAQQTRAGHLAVAVVACVHVHSAHACRRQVAQRCWTESGDDQGASMTLG